jgi:hypothetical protein
MLGRPCQPSPISHLPESHIEVVSVYYQVQQFPGPVLQHRQHEEDRGCLWSTGAGHGTDPQLSALRFRSVKLRNAEAVIAIYAVTP